MFLLRTVRSSRDWVATGTRWHKQANYTSASRMTILSRMAEQTKPKSLSAGARIGVVNPAYWLEPERLQRAVGVFEELGYELVLGKSTRLMENQYAGSAAERAADIMTMFTDASIDAIICARGGYGGNRVLPLLDYDVIRDNPKIFIGYSDITGLLASIAQRSGLVTFHGPMLTTFDEQTVQYNLDTLQQVLSGRSDVQIKSPAACKVRTLKPGIARGPAWGGNLVMVNSRLGPQFLARSRICCLVSWFILPIPFNALDTVLGERSSSSAISTIVILFIRHQSIVEY